MTVRATAFRAARRRPVRSAIGATAAVLAVGALFVLPSNRATGQALGGVDFGARVQTTSPYAVGLGSSTYGATPLTSPVEAAAERTLDARWVRVPVGIRGGVVTTSAAGAPRTDVVALVERYLSWGFHVLVVIGGRTGDLDVQPGDTTRIVSALGYGPGVQYSAPNEPSNAGRTVQDEITLARQIVGEGRSLYPAFKIWGPVWAYYDRGVLRTFAQALGPDLAGVDYHHYAMGSTSIATSTALAATPGYGSEVATTAADLTSLGLPAHVAVDETNLSWRYDDGTPGGENRFFTSAATVFLASACGHVLRSGGSCLPYASQNGALGMTVQAGGPNPDHRPISSPMPGYWGIAAWTGAHLFPHLADAFYRTTSTSTSLEVFAVSNEAHGYNIVIINKATTPVTPRITVSHVRAGHYTAYRTDPAKPYLAFHAAPSTAYTSSISVAMPSMSVTVLALRPGA